MDQDPKQKWDNVRKTQLRDKILASAASEKKNWERRRRKRIYIGAVAAVVPLLVALGLFFKQPSEPSLDDFVKDMSTDEPIATDKVTVIFNEGETVAMEEDESQVEYSATGSKVQLGSGQNVEQQTMKGDKLVFNTVLVPYGKRTFLKLSDGTKVWVNSGSKMIFPAVFKGKKREVFLEGEAIFEVAHNKKMPFLVKSKNQEIEVLGTVFNVSHYSEDSLMQTVLKSGSIRITYQEDPGKSFLIKPGTLSSFDRNSKKVGTEKVNPDDYFSWRNGFLTLNKSSLGEIASRLSRYYNQDIQIQSPELRKLSFSGRLDLSEDLHQVLQTIKKTTDFEMSEENQKIILTQ